MVNTFNESELTILRQSPYVKSVGPNKIFYGEVFDREYHRLTLKGYSMRECFESLGLDPDICGKARYQNYHKRYVKRVNNGEFKVDVTSESSGSMLQALEEKDHRIKLLEQELEFIKKKRHLTHRYMQMKALNSTTSD